MTPKISIISSMDTYRGDFPLDIYLTRMYEQTAAAEEFEVILVAPDAQCLALINQSLTKLETLKPPALQIKAVCSVESSSRAKAMNQGVRLSRAELVYFVTDDFIIPQQAVSDTLAFHQQHPDENVVGIGAAFVPEYLRSDFADWLEQSGSLFGVPFQRSMTSIPENFFYLANASLKKSFLNQAGAFNEAFPYHAWDDWEMGLRLTELGMKAILVPGTNAEHLHNLGIEDRCQAMRLAGQSARIFEHDRPDVDGPWKHFSQKSLLRQQCLARVYGAISRLLPTDRLKQHYFKAVTDAAFQRGYLDTH